MRLRGRLAAIEAAEPVDRVLFESGLHGPAKPVELGGFARQGA